MTDPAPLTLAQAAPIMRAAVRNRSYRGTPLAESERVDRAVALASDSVRSSSRSSPCAAALASVTGSPS